MELSCIFVVVMGAKGKNLIRFKSNLDIQGPNAKIVKEGLDKKMEKETRKTYTSTIEAILVEYFSTQSQKS